MPPGDLRTYLWLVAGRGAARGWIEVRYRAGTGMRSEFHATDQLLRLEKRVRSLATSTDVYVGIGIRDRQAGKKDAVGQAWLAWADCDTPEAVERLKTCSPPAGMVVASGSPGHAHAYWILRQPAGRAQIEDINRRLAFALSADPACTDAGRILRPPETRNHKREVITAVRVLVPPRAETVSVSRLLRLPSPPGAPRSRALPSQRVDRDDPLAGISATEYVPRLSGHEIDSGGKAACPFHDDHTPSLHAYADPDRGWYCFGCQRGGSIYDFAAALRGVEPRGAAFLALRDELLREFGLTETRSQRPRSGLSRLG